MTSAAKFSSSVSRFQEALRLSLMKGRSIVISAHHCQQTCAIRATRALSLSDGSLRAIRRRKDILHKFFKRSRCAVLPRTRLLRSENSRVDGLEQLDVFHGSLRRNTHLGQRLLHLVVRKLLVTQIGFA